MFVYLGANLSCLTAADTYLHRHRLGLRQVTVTHSFQQNACAPITLIDVLLEDVFFLARGE